MEISAFDMTLVPVIVVLVEIAKRLGLGSKLLPVLAILLGIGGAYLYISADIKEALLAGIIMGLSASGLWSGAKHVAEKIEP